MNRGPHDYESCAITSWAISPLVSKRRRKDRRRFDIQKHRPLFLVLSPLREVIGAKRHAFFFLYECLPVFILVLHLRHESARERSQRVKPHLFDWETHHKYQNSETRSWHQWRAATFGFASRGTADYNDVNGTQILSFGVCSIPQCGFHTRER